MWGQIPALFAKKVVVQTSKKRFRAQKYIGNHPGKRAHNRENTRILSPCMGFETRLPSDARSAQYRQSFCMKTRRKVSRILGISEARRRHSRPRDSQGAKAGATGGKMRTFLGRIQRVYFSRNWRL